MQLSVKRGNKRLQSVKDLSESINTFISVLGSVCGLYPLVVRTGIFLYRTDYINIFSAVKSFGSCQFLHIFLT